jgi:hypothetical protein
MHLEHWFYTMPLKPRSRIRRQRVEQELDEELPARGLRGKEHTAPPGTISGVSNKAEERTCATTRWSLSAANRGMTASEPCRGSQRL